MSTYLNNVFHYSRPLPAPFNKLPDKKVSVSSKYSDSTEATLNSPVLKAVMQSFGQRMNTCEGAVGTKNQFGIAEYKSSTGPSVYHIAVYDASSGSVLASVYNTDTEMNATYDAGFKGNDCSAIILAMLPSLLSDEEFNQEYYRFLNLYEDNFTDMEASVNCAGILCDNVYRRIKDETCPEHLALNIDKSGNVFRVSQTHIDSGKFIPDEVFCGAFRIFSDKSAEPVPVSAGNETKQQEFCGQYAFSERTFSPEESELIPELPEWYVIPKEVTDICRHAKATTGKPTAMRNFLLRGPAGTGKTMGARAIAAGLGLPYVKYTCSANSEIFDFVGSIIPDFDDKSVPGKGYASYPEIAEDLNLPGIDDIDYDPAGVYEKLTGTKNRDATAQDCMQKLLELVIKAAGGNKKPQNTPSYSYVETDFIKALKYGYVVEIQEPTTIMQPGVLVGLNSLLEQEGNITLPNGEVIHRHPDAVVVVTTNISYEGCRGLNQSVVDRMSLVRDIELPSPEVMTQRAMKVTGAEDEHLVGQMVSVVSSMENYCRQNSITDGCIGMRSLIDWINSTLVTDDPYSSAVYTVISKATADPSDREALITTCLEPVFCRRFA